MKHYSRILAVIGVLALASTASATTMTFATFADPAANANQPLFQYAADYSSVQAAWTQPGLTLEVPFAGQTFSDVQFQLYGANPSQTGYIEFWTNSGPLMRVDFSSAALSEFSFGARDTFANSGVVEITYYPWGGSVDLTEEAFAFSFTNIVETPQGITATAAFTSSAVPEPTTFVVLGLGCVVMLRRRFD